MYRSINYDNNINNYNILDNINYNKSYNINDNQNYDIKLPLDIKDYNNKYRKIFITYKNKDEYKKLYELSKRNCIRCNINHKINIKKCLNNNYIDLDIYKDNKINTIDDDSKYFDDMNNDTNKHCDNINIKIDKNKNLFNYDIYHSYLLCKHQFCNVCNSYGHNEIICKYLVFN